MFYQSKYIMVEIFPEVMPGGQDSVTVKVFKIVQWGGSRVRDFWESGGFCSSLVDSIVLRVTAMAWYPDEDD